MQQLKKYLADNMINDFLSANNMTIDEYVNGNHDNRTSWKYPDSWVSVTETMEMYGINSTSNRSRTDGPTWYQYINSLPSVNDFELFVNSISYEGVLRNTTYILDRIKNGDFTGT